MRTSIKSAYFAKKDPAFANILRQQLQYQLVLTVKTKGCRCI